MRKDKSPTPANSPDTTTQAVTKLTMPASATHPLVAASGVGAFLLAVVVVHVGKPFTQVYQSMLFAVLCVAAGVFLPDLLWQKVHRRASAGYRLGPRRPSWKRTFTKFAGLLGSVGLVALAYFLFPEYHAGFYDNYYSMLKLIGIPWAVLAIPYLYWMDGRMAEPEDSLWAMGQLVTLHWGEIDREQIKQHLLAWTVKGFFLPLMFIYACNDMGRFTGYDLGHLDSFQGWYDLLYDLFYFIDVGLVTTGYLFALQATDTHIRSAEPTGLGWGIALLCYEPFWSLIGRQYIAYDAGNGSWAVWLQNSPVLYIIWGSLILLMVMIYAWSTMSFGARFSNLTHRGIITSGPYRWLKHPAYLSKNISWWLISIPFMTGGDAATTLRYCVLLLLLNGVYYLRALTEERHLSRDPVYVQYARWVEAHGLLCWLRLPSPFRRSTAVPGTAVERARSRA